MSSNKYNKKIRKTWEINPVERIIKNKKVYKRKFKNRREFTKEIEGDLEG